MKRTHEIASWLAALAAAAAWADPTAITGVVDLKETGDVTYAGITGSGELTNSGETLRTVTLALPATASTSEEYTTFAGKVTGNIHLVVESGSATAVQIFSGSSASTYTGGTKIICGELRATATQTRFGTGEIELAAASSYGQARLCWAVYAVATWPNDLRVTGAGGRFRTWNGSRLTLQKLTLAENATLFHSDSGAAGFKSLDPSSKGTIFCDWRKNPLVFGDNFFTAADGSFIPVTLSGMLNNTIYCEGRLALPDYSSSTMTFRLLADSPAYRNGTADLARPALGGLSFRSLKVTSGTLTIAGPDLVLSDAQRTTDVTVAAGASLVVDGAICCPTNAGARTLRKLGAGRLVLNGRVDTEAAVSVCEGTLGMGTNACLLARGNFSCETDGRIVLHDGSCLANACSSAGENTHTGFLATAAVWFDAAALQHGEGVTVSNAPNYGTCGGSFYWPYDNTVSTYSEAGFDGHPAICQSTTYAGLVLDAYTNYTDQITTFLVYQWDSWSHAGGEPTGGWGGPLSLSTCRGDATKEDKQYASLVYSFGERSGEQGAAFPTNASVFACGTSAPLNWPVSYAPGQMTILGFRRNGKTMRSFGRIPEGTYDFGDAAANATKFQIERVALGKRLRGDGGLGWQRGCRGKFGELLVFSRALSDDEVAYVNAYLTKKWYGLGDGGTAPSCAAADAARPASALALDVPADEAATLAGPTSPDTLPLALEKTGAGELALAGAVTNLARAAAAAGTLALTEQPTASQAYLWLDAADATVRTLADGRVTAVRDKGSHGGVWTPTYNVKGPTLSAAALNGRDVFTCDGNAALSLTDLAFTQTARNLHVYGVFRRAKANAWGGPFSLGTRNEKENFFDNGASGNGFHYEDLIAAGCAPSNAFCVVGWTYLPCRYVNNQAFLFASHQTATQLFFGFETADDDGPTPTLAQTSSGLAAVRATMAQVGGRIGSYGGAYIAQSPYGDGNRMWYGDVAEFIVFDRVLSSEDEVRLVDYLRKKWFGRGTGDATPPPVLTGMGGTPVLAPETDLALAAGTTLASDAPVLTVASLALEDGVTLARRSDAATPEALRMFDVTGLLSLGATAAFRYGTAKTEGFLVTAQTVSGAPVWTVTGQSPTGATVRTTPQGIWYSGRKGCQIIVR